MQKPEPSRAPAAAGGQLAASRDIACRQVLDTTELRWFGVGGLPAGTSRWFGEDGGAGVIEERVDTYRVGRRTDIGVKLRWRRTLELKALLSPGVPFSLDVGLDGKLEMWRKWTPAERFLPHDDRARWIDVRKTIVKRRFSVAGDEDPSPDTTVCPPEGGVDVETVELVVGDRTAWSFAFAAFGPVECREVAIRNGWLALAATAPPSLLWSSPLHSGGYPGLLVASVRTCSSAGSFAS